MSMVTPDTSASELRLLQAFEASRAAMEALDPKSLPHINVDIPASIITVLGCMPELKQLQPQLATLTAVDPAVFDKCEQYAHALYHANRQYISASQPSAPVAEMTETLRGIREQLFSDAAALAKRGALDGERFKKLAGPNGSKNIALDVHVLVSMLRDNWSKIVGKTFVTLDELDRSEVMADRLIDALGEREQGPVNVPAASVARHRAYALFVKAYDEARRVVSFLRWHEGDAENIAPSLYKGRNAKPGRSETTPDPATDETIGVGNQPAVPVVPVATPVTLPGVSAPFANG